MENGSKRSEYEAVVASQLVHPITLAEVRELVARLSLPPDVILPFEDLAVSGDYL